jgi:hypothetical protein
MSLHQLVSTDVGVDSNVTATARPSEKQARRIWPLIAIILGIALTMAWNAMLVYGLYRLSRVVAMVT